MAEAQGKDVTPEDSALESFKGSSEEELTKRIVALVEFYLSDEHILYNAFLLKYVLKNTEGYISLKLMTCFRKLKNIKCSMELVRKALRSSTMLEVNAEGSKVRRRAPLPENAETVAARTVVIYPLPDGVSVEAVMEKFLPCGNFSLTKLLRSGGVVPHCARQFLQKHPDMGRCSAAVVEFGQHEGASQALRQDSPSLRVLPLFPSPRTATDLTNTIKTGIVACVDSPKSRPVVPFKAAVSQPAQGPLHKSQGEANVSARPCFKMESKGAVAVLRQPRGPDGTTGFHHRDARDGKVNAAEEAWKGAVKAAGDVGDGAVNAAGDAGDGTVNAAEEAGDGAVNVAEEAGDSVVNVAEEAGDGAVNGAAGQQSASCLSPIDCLSH